MKYTIAGMMSGTSLDGLDMAICSFSEDTRGWHFTIDDARCIAYPAEWKKRLQHLVNDSAFNFAETHAALGKYFGEQILAFISQTGNRPQLICSHGHTIFHEPSKRFTTQIGDAAAIYAITGIPVVSDFRVLDVYRGGQGAPLVPAGDELLFPDYHFLLNLGGIANVSFAENNTRKAFDICPCNIILNHFAGKTGNNYDEGGIMAARGKVNEYLLHLLNEQDYYNLPLPKSLDKTYVEKVFVSLAEAQQLSPYDTLATLSMHIALKISEAFNNARASTHSNIMITGGGAFNNHLISLIRKYTAARVIIPDEKLVNYKEALIFAFLGLLRALGRENIFKSYTGANSNSMGGMLWGEFII